MGMEVVIASAGSYPRIGEASGQQRLRKAYAQRETGDIPELQYAAIEDEVAREVLEEQATAGVDVLTDGLIRWYDPISHTGRALAGVTINGLLRYFDTNFYFRQPVVRDRLARHRPIVAAEYRFAVKHARKPVKAVLTGPYTLARHSLLATSAYSDTAALALAYAEMLAEEVAELAADGARHVQIDEPAILRSPADMPLLARALRPIADAKGAAELTLAVYFGDAMPVLDALQTLPVDVLALDLASSPALATVLAERGGRLRLALGVLDGRNTRLEDVRTITAMLEPILARYADRVLYLTTSCGLELLPRDSARRKLERLDEVRRSLAGASR